MISPVRILEPEDKLTFPPYPSQDVAEELMLDREIVEGALTVIVPAEPPEELRLRAEMEEPEETEILPPREEPTALMLPAEIEELATMVTLAAYWLEELALISPEQMYEPEARVTLPAVPPQPEVLLVVIAPTRRNDVAAETETLPPRAPEEVVVMLPAVTLPPEASVTLPAVEPLELIF